MDDRFPGWGRGGKKTPLALLLSISETPHLGASVETCRMYFKDSRSSQRSGLEVGGFHRSDPAGLAPQSSFGGKTKCRCPAPPAGQGTLEAQERCPGVLGEWVGEGGRVLSAGAMSRPGCGGNHTIEDVVRIRVPCCRRGGWSALRARPVEHSVSGHPTPLHHWQLGPLPKAMCPVPALSPWPG